MSLNQKWNSNTYNKNASFVSDYGNEVLTLLNSKQDEKILDIGCGDGTLARKLCDRGSKVIGVDASESMVESAVEKGIEAYVINATDIEYKEEFDAVFSNAALHWMKPPEKVAKCIYNALKVGGRFVAEFGGKGNVYTIQSALIEAVSKRGKDGNALNPWYFPSPEDYKLLLESVGFTVEKCQLFDRLTPLNTGMLGWLETFSYPFVSSFSKDEVEDILKEVENSVKFKLKNAKDEWFADYVRLRVKAHKN